MAEFSLPANSKINKNGKTFGAPAGARFISSMAGVLVGGSARQYARSLTRKRAIDWLCSWQTRDSVTLSTAAISFRFMSCS